MDVHEIIYYLILKFRNIFSKSSYLRVDSLFLIQCTVPKSILNVLLFIRAKYISLQSIYLFSQINYNNIISLCYVHRNLVLILILLKNNIQYNILLLPLLTFTDHDFLMFDVFKIIHTLIFFRIRIIKSHAFSFKSIYFNGNFMKIIKINFT